ncbi:MAG: trimethylamine methyltransferase family protein, partial [Desulforhopalus sp.]
MGREEDNHQPVTRLKVLRAEGIAQIHQAVLQVMEYPGVRVHDDEARRLLVGAGALPAEDNFITFSSQVIENGLQKLPNSLRLYDRNGSVALDTANRRPYFATGLFCA